MTTDTAPAPTPDEPQQGPDMHTPPPSPAEPDVEAALEEEQQELAKATLIAQARYLMERNQGLVVENARLRRQIAELQEA